ncbi:GEVED domain-containing protein [Chitinivorax sp. B]|uniref:GEVED domain-containing protein n=1 Tax=Chitinivorax sp. B TaxID=2502235 RepID=UPI0010F9E491|nr:GEVED domain-containing protein [Chitinivorax sp. B]
MPKPSPAYLLITGLMTALFSLPGNAAELALSPSAAADGIDGGEAGNWKADGKFDLLIPAQQTKGIAYVRKVRSLNFTQLTDRRSVYEFKLPAILISNDTQIASATLELPIIGKWGGDTGLLSQMLLHPFSGNDKVELADFAKTQHSAIVIDPNKMTVNATFPVDVTSAIKAMRGGANTSIGFLLGMTYWNDMVNIGSPVRLRVQYNDMPTNYHPIVQIQAPTTGALLQENAPATLIAVATDREDSDLSSLIRWSLDDQTDNLGTGGAVNVSLPVGLHVLKAQVTDQAGQTSMTSTTVQVKPAIAACSAVGNIQHEHIQSVTVNGQGRAAGNDWGYFDGVIAHPALNLQRGHNSMVLTPGYWTRQPTASESWQVWIDFNRDGRFSQDEIVTATQGTGPLKTALNIFSSRPAGSYRMRVIMNHGGAVPGCNGTISGEVEDYLVKLN